MFRLHSRGYDRRRVTNHWIGLQILILYINLISFLQSEEVIGPGGLERLLVWRLPVTRRLILDRTRGAAS